MAVLEGESTRWAGNEDTARGTAGEPIACAAYARLTRRTVTQCGLFLHRTHDWLAASPDGLLDGNGLLEIKCPRYVHASGIPPIYMAQVQGQLHIAERAWAHFFSFVAGGGRDGGDVCALYQARRSVWLLLMHAQLLTCVARAPHPQVSRDDAYWAWLLPRLRTFYTAVQAEVEPAIGELQLRPGEAPPHVAITCLGRWGFEDAAAA